MSSLNGGYIGKDVLGTWDRHWNLCVLALSHITAASVPTDKSQTGAVITEEGTSAIATTQTKFTTKSMHFVGTVGENFALASPSDLGNTFDSNFTFSCWFRTTDLTGANTLFRVSGSGPYVSINVQPDGRSDINIDTDAAAYVGVRSATGVIIVNTWHWIGFQRIGDEWNLYIDGIWRAVGTAAGGFGTLTDSEIGQDVVTSPMVGDLSEMLVHTTSDIDLTDVPTKSHPLYGVTGVHGVQQDGLIGVYG